MVTNIFNSLNDYLLFFSFIGLSPNINRSKVSVKYQDRLPIVLFTVFFLTLDVIGIIILLLPWNDGKPLEIIVGNVFVLSDVMKIIGICMQSCMHTNTLSSILFDFQHIDELFVNLPLQNIDYRLFRKAFTNKCMIIVISYMFNVGAFAVRIVPTRIGFWQLVIFKFWQFGSIVSTIHMMFYIDLLRYHLQQLNLSFRNINIQSRFDKTTTSLQVTKKIMNMKLIHFKLWEISHKINVTFGWTISAVLFQQFVDSTYSLYWLIFLVVQRAATTIAILRRFPTIKMISIYVEEP